MKYEKIKNQPHIFIFSVAGRTGSTALQRFLNSSNEICIYGEPECLGIHSKFLSLIDHLEKVTKTAFYENRLKGYDTLKKDYKKNKQTSFYPTAGRPLENALASIKDSYCEIFKPLIRTKRIGSKDVHLQSISTLSSLKKLFPKSYILFLFRDPIKQFLSVNKCGYHPYSKTPQDFIDEYHRISSILLEFNEQNQNSPFIENKRLFNEDSLDRLLKQLQIKKMDKSLINKKVNSTSDHTISEDIETQIKNSKAYKNYTEMVNRSNNFFENL